MRSFLVISYFNPAELEPSLIYEHDQEDPLQQESFHLPFIPLQVIVREPEDLGRLKNTSEFAFQLYQVRIQLLKRKIAQEEKGSKKRAYLRCKKILKFNLKAFKKIFHGERVFIPSEKIEKIKSKIYLLLNKSENIKELLELDEKQYHGGLSDFFMVLSDVEYLLNYIASDSLDLSEEISGEFLKNIKLDYDNPAEVTKELGQVSVKLYLFSERSFLFHAWMILEDLYLGPHLKRLFLKNLLFLLGEDSIIRRRAFLKCWWKHFSPFESLLIKEWILLQKQTSGDVLRRNLLKQKLVELKEQQTQLTSELKLSKKLKLPVVRKELMAKRLQLLHQEEELVREERWNCRKKSKKMPLLTTETAINRLAIEEPFVSEQLKTIRFSVYRSIENVKKFFSWCIQFAFSEAPLKLGFSSEYILGHQILFSLLDWPCFEKIKENINIVDPIKNFYNDAPEEKFSVITRAVKLKNNNLFEVQVKIFAELLNIAKCQQIHLADPVREVFLDILSHPSDVDKRKKFLPWIKICIASKIAPLDIEKDQAIFENYWNTNHLLAHPSEILLMFSGVEASIHTGKCIYSVVAKHLNHLKKFFSVSLKHKKLLSLGGGDLVLSGKTMKGESDELGYLFYAIAACVFFACHAPTPSKITFSNMEEIWRKWAKIPYCEFHFFISHKFNFLRDFYSVISFDIGFTVKDFVEFVLGFITPFPIPRLNPRDKIEKLALNYIEIQIESHQVDPKLASSSYLESLSAENDRNIGRFIENFPFNITNVIANNLPYHYSIACQYFILNFFSIYSHFNGKLTFKSVWKFFERYLEAPLWANTLTYASYLQEVVRFKLFSSKLRYLAFLLENLIRNEKIFSERYADNSQINCFIHNQIRENHPGGKNSVVYFEKIFDFLLSKFGMLDFDIFFPDFKEYKGELDSDAMKDAPIKNKIVNYAVKFLEESKIIVDYVKEFWVFSNSTASELSKEILKGVQNANPTDKVNPVLVALLNEPPVPKLSFLDDKLFDRNHHSPFNFSSTLFDDLKDLEAVEEKEDENDELPFCDNASGVTITESSESVDHASSSISSSSLVAVSIFHANHQQSLEEMEVQLCENVRQLLSSAKEIDSSPEVICEVIRSLRNIKTTDCLSFDEIEAEEDDNYQNLKNLYARINALVGKNPDYFIPVLAREFPQLNNQGFSLK